MALNALMVTRVEIYVHAITGYFVDGFENVQYTWNRVEL